ncbi:MAG: MFS transporter [Planctomycetes bacterium]|nr:MFS transporter [Planctomycetota bacterium]
MQSESPAPLASTGSPAERPTRIRWWILVLSCSASFVLYLHRYSWGIIKPAFRNENPSLTDTEIGWLDSAFSLTYAIAQIPAGVAADMFGPRLVLAAIILLWSVSAAGIAWTSGFWNLFGVRAVFGLAQAGALPGVNKVARSWFSPAVRTSVQGLIASMGRFGAAGCSVILATLLIGVFGMTWRTALVTLAVPGLVLGIAWWLIVRNSPREHPGVNTAERDLISGVAPVSTAPRVPIRWNRATIFNLGMLLLYSFASAFQDQLFVNWIPSFLVQGRGMSNTQMGLLSTLPLVGGALGGICGGFLNDYLIRRTGNRRWSRSGVAFTGKFLAAGLVVLSVYMPSGGQAMVVLLVARFFSDWSLAAQWGAITDMSGRATATVFGLVNTIGALGMFAAGPVLGALKQHHSWEGMFLGAAAMCVLSAVAWLFIDCTRRLVDD